MTNTLISRFLSGIILCFFTGNLFALNTYDISGFDEKIYTYHFDRADQESDLSSWMREAQFGMALAVSEWERQSVDLYTDPEFRAEAGVALRQWTQEELEKRFSQWLFKRFFGDLSGEMIKKLDNAVEEANRLYTYHTDDDGNVLYDETGSPMVIRPYEYHNLEEERELWARHLVSAASNELQKYQAKISALFPELLAYIDKDKRNDFEKKLHEVLANSVINKRNEFEAILAREKRLFTARRTGDIYSLRKESENASAAMIISQLIRETENSCNAGIASLEERIEAAKAGTGDLALAGEEWLAAFQEQFEKGLKAWTDAEERFIMRRMEWERDSGDKFLEGQEAWRNAFRELENKRIEWEDDAFRLLKEGLALFQDISQQLNDAITKARDEFVKDASLRINSGTEQISAWVEMYITCTSVMAEAKDSIDFWLSRFSGTPPENALENGILGSLINSIMNKGNTLVSLFQNQNYLSSFLTENQKFAGTELIRWSDIYASYKTKANEAMAELEKQFGLVLGMDIGALDSVLYNNSENFFLDEYQIELLRAKAISGYWENRLAIAESVIVYAEDVSAGRMTEAESYNKWLKAKENYENAIKDYEESQINLRLAGKDLDKAKKELEAIAIRINEAESALNEIYKDYSVQLEAYRLDNTDYIQNQLNKFYSELTELYDSRLRDNDYYTAYLNAEINYIEEYMLQYSWLLLNNILFNGENDPVLKNLQLSLLASNSAIDWYYNAIGKQQNENDRISMEEEGFINRLKREANEGTYGALSNKILAAYRELVYCAPGLQKESVNFAIKSLNKVFTDYNIGVEADTLPDIDNIADKLLEYGKVNDKSIGEILSNFLLEIDIASEVLPEAFENQLTNWKETLTDYMVSRALYLNINIPEDIEETLKNYQLLITSISINNNNGNSENNIEVSDSVIMEIGYCQYLLDFLIKYDEKNRLANKYKNDITEHWRYFNYETYDYESDSAETANILYLEYLMADSIEMAQKAGIKLQKTIDLFIGNVLSDSQNEFIVIAKEYFRNPGKEWNVSYNNRINKENSFSNEYAELLSIASEEYEYENTLKQRIIDNGKLYLIMRYGNDDIKNMIIGSSSDIEAAKASYNNVINEYTNKANEYAEIGKEYERLYSISKKLYDDINVKRLDYEKQDAIQRWAGTAYLYNDAELSENLQYYKEPLQELEYCRERYNNALAALAVLESLYNNQETTRPFENGEYKSAFQEYQESFENTLLAFKARTEMSYDIQARLSKQEEIYFSYISNLFKLYPNLTQISSYYTDYKAPDLEKSTLLDFLYIKDSGELGISRDNETKKLIQINQGDADKLSNYFNDTLESSNKDIFNTNFEKALISWAERMTGYNFAGNKIEKTNGKFNSFVQNMNRILNNLSGDFNNLSLALDYLFDELSQNNPEISALTGLNNQTNMGVDGDMKIDGRSLNTTVSDFHNGNLKWLQVNAWNNLTAQQQSDLEFLAIILLTGGSDKLANGFDYVSNLMEMQAILDRANSYIHTYSILFVKVTGYYYPYWVWDHSDLDEAKSAAVNREWNYSVYIEYSKTEFSSIINNLASNAELYSKNSEVLALLQNNNRNIEIDWKDIETYLFSLNTFTAQEISKLNQSWDRMMEYKKNNGNDYGFYSIGNAINAIFDWNNEMTTNLELELAAVYIDKEKQRLANQNNLRNLYDAYINNGSTALEELTHAAHNAYGAESAAIKNHYYNIGSMLISSLKTINADHMEYVQYGGQIANKLTYLMAQCYQSRYAAELASREIEWAEQLKDLKNKYNAWEEASGLILERGRNDWKDGIEKMETAYEQWKKDFLDQYGKINEAWDIAYLESLQNKELWINSAINTASDAHNNMLMLIGQDAEAGSRKLDSFMPSAYLDSSGIERASETMNAVLSSAGIANLYSAVTAMSGSAGTVLTQTRSGVSGLGTWNSNMAKAAAKELASSSTTDLASAKMKIFAFQARESLYAKKNAFEEQVTESNKGIDQSIDDIYLLQGGWSKSGNSYSKNIIVHSTVFTSAITDRTVLESYRWYVMDGNWDFSADLSDSNLEIFDYMQILEITKKADEEIISKNREIFGDEEKKGKFQEWIGEYSGNTQEINGEIDRLIKQYIYWENQQAQGIALMNSPLWDKPLWDSRGSWFSAPSIRSVVDIATSVIATVVGGPLLSLGINMLDDLLFTALDVGFGYKSWDEAGFEFGKKALISGAAAGGGALFGGAGNLTAKAVGNTTGFLKTSITVGMGAAQAITVGTATSAISAITYKDGQFGWSGDAFRQGMTATFQGAAVGGVTSFTTGTLNNWNIGDGNENLVGFNKMNIKDAYSFNNFVGGLAGQGLNYALTGDFALNVLNLNSFTDNSNLNMGLLELHFTKDGPTMNLGSGGMDASYKTLASVFRGMDVLNTNHSINNFTEKNDMDIAIALRLLYGFGDKEQSQELKNILKGDTILQEAPEGAGYGAKSVAENGKKTIYINDSLKKMEENDQMRLGAILGHEAYRDGYESSNKEEAFNEFLTATVARIEMGNRINSEYTFFYANNADLAVENVLYQVYGETEYFTNYLNDNYNYDEDYYWRKITRTVGYQNGDINDRDIILLNARNREDAAKYNEEEFRVGIEKYRDKLKNLEDYQGKNKDLYTQRSDEEIIALFKANEKIRTELGVGYDPFYNLYDYGCFLYSGVNIVSSVVGIDLDPKLVNKFAKENYFEYGESALYPDKMAELMTALTGNAYTFTHVNLPTGRTVMTNEDYLFFQNQQFSEYVAIVKLEGSGIPKNHFAAVNEYHFYTSEKGYGLCIDLDSKKLMTTSTENIARVTAVNPWYGKGYNVLSSTIVVPDNIVRTDVYKVTKNFEYKKDMAIRFTE